MGKRGRILAVSWWWSVGVGTVSTEQACLCSLSRSSRVLPAAVCLPTAYDATATCRIGPVVVSTSTVLFLTVPPSPSRIAVDEFPNWAPCFSGVAKLALTRFPWLLNQESRAGTSQGTNREKDIIRPLSLLVPTSSARPLQGLHPRPGNNVICIHGLQRALCRLSPLAVLFLVSCLGRFPGVSGDIGRGGEVVGSGS